MSTARPGTAPTPILDHADQRIRALASAVVSRIESCEHAGSGGQIRDDGQGAMVEAGRSRALVRAAHALVGERVAAAYLLDDRQPASRTLARGEGSCSQRFAVLEAVLRACGVPTRTHGLLVPGQFWAPRFPALSRMLPDEVPIAWPEVLVVDRWRTVPELLLDDGHGDAATTFTNDAETLFDAVSHVRICWDTASACAIDGLPATSLGRFACRDEFFDAHGEPFCRLGRHLVEPIVRRSA